MEPTRARVETRGNPHGPRTLGFVGDLMLGRQIDASLGARGPETFWGDVLPLMQGADFVVGNLECPITEHPQRWRRGWKLFHMRTGPAAVNLLRAGNIGFVSLANNHILDFDEAGLFDTLRHLDRAGIAHAGAGGNSAEAAEPALLRRDGLCVGFLALTDNIPEFAAAPGRPGTNYVRVSTDHVTLTLLEAQVRALRAAGAAFVVLSAHWGPNLRPWPPARFRRFAREAVGLGVDVLHGHSAHLIQGVEACGRGLILYDTGDFLDDYWIFPGIRTDRSMLFLVDFDQAGLARLRMVPVSIGGGQVRLARGAERQAIERVMRARCARLGTRLLDRPDGLELDLRRNGLAQTSVAAVPGYLNPFAIGQAAI